MFAYTRSHPLLLALSLLSLSQPANAEQSDPVCAAIVKPGLYLLHPFSSQPVPISGPVAYEEGARIYVKPWFGPKLVDTDKELVWHIRMQTTARSSLRSNQVYVYHPRLQTQCADGSYAGPGRGAWFPEFPADERYVSLRRYNDHHAKTDPLRREDGGLARYFHFEVSKPDERSCFRTDDSKVVGNLDAAYGFRDVPVPPPLTSPPSLVSDARAEPAEPTSLSPKYAGLASLFVHLSGPADACFSVAVPMPTSSSLFRQFFTSGRDEYAQQQGRSWNPDRTDLDLHVLPTGKHYYAQINWLDAGTPEARR